MPSAPGQQAGEAVSPVAIVWPCPLAVDAYAAVELGGQAVTHRYIREPVPGRENQATDEA